jgi:uncharacterized protein YjbJ (UPF0337 family)
MVASDAELALRCPITDTRPAANDRKDQMTGFLDRLLGRGKKAAGDVAGDPELRHEGMHQEAEGTAESRADRAEDMAEDARTEAAEHRTERNDPM